MTKIFRGLSGLCAYQPVFSGKDGSVRAKSAGQSLLDENLQVHNSIITHCYVMVIVLSVQALGIKMETQNSIKTNKGIGILGSLADTKINERLLPANEAAANIINMGDNSEKMQKWRDRQATKAKQEYDEATRQFDISSQVLKKSFPGLVELLENSPAEQHDEILNKWKEENSESVVYLDNAIDTLQKDIIVLNNALLSYSNKLLAFEAGKIKANGASGASAGPAGSVDSNAKNGLFRN